MELQTKSIVALAVAVTVGQVQVNVGGRTYTLSAGQTAYAKEGERKAVREMTGELTKVDAQSLTVTVYREGGPRDETFKLADAVKVALETGEMGAAQGKEGKSRAKTVEGKAGDLKVGQRVRVQYDAGVASRILVLQVRDPAKSRESKREKGSAPEAKPRKGSESEREREEASAQAKPAEEGRQGGERTKG